MIEIVTVDGKQFELTTEYPLTEQQRQQTISDIRRQTGCTSCNKTQSLDGSIQTLAASCVNVTVDAPANVTITDVRIDGITCMTGTCASHLVCASSDCTTKTATVVVTFQNSGDLDASITPTLKIGEVDVGTLSPSGPVPIAKAIGVYPSMTPGVATATFTVVVLSRGSNTVCADLTYV